MSRIIFLVGLALWGFKTASASCDLQKVFPQLNYVPKSDNMVFPCESTKNIYLQTKRYDPKSILITRAQIDQNVVYACIPRLKRGVPFSLAKMTLIKGECVPPIEPYPCWSIQEEGNCQAIQTCVDLVHDPKNILWVLDTGDTNTLEQPIHRCEAKVIGIDTTTNKVVSTVQISDLISEHSRLQHLAVEYDETGRGFIYISDGGENAILVWDLTEQRGYKIILPPAVYKGCSEPDVLYLSLIRKSNGINHLYLNYLCGSHLFSIKTSHLRRGEGSSAVVDHGAIPGDKNLVHLGTDNGQYLFVRAKNQRDIYIYNTETLLKSNNFILVMKGGECRLATHVFPGYKNYMWVLSSNTPHFVAGTVGHVGPDMAIHPLVKDCDS